MPAPEVDAEGRDLGRKVRFRAAGYPGHQMFFPARNRRRISISCLETKKTAEVGRRFRLLRMQAAVSSVSHQFYGRRPYVIRGNVHRRGASWCNYFRSFIQMIPADRGAAENNLACTKRVIEDGDSEEPQTEEMEVEYGDAVPTTAFDVSLG